MSLIVEFRASSPKLPLSDSLARVPEMTLTVEQATADDPQRPLLFLWASGDDFAAFEAACAEDPTVAAIDLLDDIGDKRLYRVQVSPEEGVVLYPVDVRVGASRLAVRATHRGLETRMRFPDRETLTEYSRLLEEMDVSFSLLRLYESEGPDSTSEYGLSRKQRRALTTAVESGYYEVPRDTSLADLSDRLDISRQATSERLRRGTKALVVETLHTDE